MSSLRQRIIRETIDELGDDTKFIRLATVTQFIHSLIFTIFMLRYSRYFVSDGIVDNVIEFFQESLSFSWGWIIPLIILWVFLAIWYWILPPIGEAAMLIYRDEWRRQWTASLSKGTGVFFQMFEFHATTWFFAAYVIFFAMVRMWAVWALFNWVVITLFIFRISLSVLVTIFFSYSKMLITLEWMKFFEAMKESTRLSVRHFGITLQFSILTVILYIRFIINIILLVWVPLLLIWIGIWLGINEILILQLLLVVVILWLILLISYIEWIIEAFFVTCRWKVWRIIKAREEADQNAPSVTPESIMLEVNEAKSYSEPQTESE